MLGNLRMVKGTEKENKYGKIIHCTRATGITIWLVGKVASSTQTERHMRETGRKIRHTATALTTTQMDRAILGSGSMISGMGMAFKNGQTALFIMGTYKLTQ